MALEGRFRKTVFSNGLVLVTETHREFRSLSIGAWVKTGARFERMRESGISHFLEHMLFKGTASRSALDIAREIDTVGGEFNAFTAREYTCFHFLLLDRDLGLGMDVLSDIVLNSEFDPEEFERERKVVMQEIAMVGDSPEELVHDMFFERIYGRHGLGKPILGTTNSVRSMRRGDLLRYFRKHYRPERMIVSVSGNVTHEAARKALGNLVRQCWPGRCKYNGADRYFGYVPAPEVRSGRWWAVRHSEQAHIVWGVAGPKYSSRDRFPTLLLNMYIGGGMSSALFQEIREKNALAYSVYSSLTPFLDSGILTVYAATAPGQVAHALRLIEDCIGRLMRETLKNEELDVIKKNLKGTILLSSDSVEARMSSIAKNEMFFGRHVPVEDVCRAIDVVTPADVRRAARRLLGTGRRSVLVVGPRPRKRRGWGMIS